LQIQRFLRGGVGESKSKNYTSYDNFTFDACGKNKKILASGEERLRLSKLVGLGDEIHPICGSC
jgi:hypothetical protein